VKPLQAKFCGFYAVSATSSRMMAKYAQGLLFDSAGFVANPKRGRVNAGDFSLGTVFAFRFR
jgi:hypothetical protein